MGMGKKPYIIQIQIYVFSEIMTDNNSVSLLTQKCQTLRLIPNFSLTQVSGASHCPVFSVQVCIKCLLVSKLITLYLCSFNSRLI